MIYTEPPVNLPACWLNKTITMRKGSKLVAVTVTMKMLNQNCRCYQEKTAFFCQHGGKLLHCNKTNPETKGGEANGESKGDGKEKAKQRGKSKTQSSVAGKTTRKSR